MSGYGFTEDSARRIVNAVRKVEGDTTPPVAVGPRFTGSQMSVVKVTSLGSPFATGQRVDYNASANTRADINQVKIKEVNGATLTVGNYYVGLFSGYTTTDDPLFLVNVSGSGGGGNAVIDVVTDVTCDPVNGLVVSTVTLSGADYDNAVIRNFLALSDVDAKSYVGNAGRVVQVNATADGLEFGAVVSGVSDSFISLTDTPPAYGSTNTYKVLTVSSTNAGISFSDNNITTKNSIKGGGNPNNPTTYAALELVGDVSTPVANYFYGADSSSVRGWYKVKFTSLDNVPNSFSGQAGKFLKVNTGATALEFAEVDIADILTRLSAAETAITTLQTDLATAQTDISTLQTDLATAQTDITTLQTDLATAQTDISTLQTDLATAQTDITNNYNSLDSRITALGG
jgi:hypothetical protein